MRKVAEINTSKCPRQKIAAANGQMEKVNFITTSPQAAINKHHKLLIVKYRHRKMAFTLKGQNFSGIQILRTPIPNPVIRAHQAPI